MNVINIFIIVVGVINLSLGFMFLFHSEKDQRLELSLAMLTFISAIWAFLMVIFRFITDSSQLNIITHALYAVPLFLPPFFLYFILYFLNRGRRNYNPRWLRVVLFVPALVFFFLVLFTSSVIKSVVFVPGSENIIFFGPLYFIYVVYFVLVFGVSYNMLLQYYLTSTQRSFPTRSALLTLFLSTAIPLTVSLITSLLLPWFGFYALNWAGPTTTVFFVCAIVYAIYRHQVLDIKIIGTELLVFIMWIFVLIQFLISIGAQERFLNGLILIGALLFGNYIIRKVKEEVLNRERFQAITNEIQITNRRLKQLNAQQKEFISVASHQLRTPLTAVRGYASMLAEGSFGSFEGRARDAIEVVEDESRTLSQSVDNLLVASRIERGQMQFHNREVDISELIQELFESIRPRAERKGVGMRIDMLPSKHYVVCGDSDKLRHVFSNLIQHAIRHANNGFVRVKLDQDAGIDAPIRVSISDTGRGMTQKEIEYAFERIQQDYISLDITKPIKIGTGLFVSQELVSKHGGKIWVESPGLGKGTTFFVELPAFTQKSTQQQFNNT